MGISPRILLMASALALASAMPTLVRGAEFFAGKTIELLIGGDVGGGYDVYARTIGRHLGRHIPGEPAVLPKNLPGAGSGRAAAMIYSTVPKNGTVIGAVFPGVIMGPLLEDRAQILFDPVNFAYLGSADNGTRVCVTFEHSKIRSYEDAIERKTIIGASAAGGSTRDYANLHKNAAGANFVIVTGYKGTTEIFLAMERGEVDGMCGLDWASLKSQRPDWLRDHKINILVQVNLEPEPELSRLGVPQIWRYVKGDEDKSAVELVIGQQVFGRPYLAPPGVPADRLSLLRAAFMATIQDPDFLADAERTRVDITPSSGEKVQQLVEKLYSMPKRVVERAKDIVRF
jgi:tripartite-type tricarboxylate transporter receptor subunit TctC